MNTVTLPTFSSHPKKQNDYNTYAADSSSSDEDENVFCSKNQISKMRSSGHSSFNEADIKNIHKELMIINK